MSRIRPIRDKSVDELEGTAPRPPFPTEYAARVAAARRRPIRELSEADLRALLTQKHAPAYLLPLAAERLAHDPWLEAEYYEGDLLSAICAVDPSFWPRGGEWRESLAALLRRSLEVAPADPYARNTIVEAEVRAVLEFLEAAP